LVDDRLIAGVLFKFQKPPPYSLMPAETIATELPKARYVTVWELL